MIHIRHSIVFLLFLALMLLLFFAALFSSLPGQNESVTPVETITAESIRHHVYFLASDTAVNGERMGSARRK